MGYSFNITVPFWGGGGRGTLIEQWIIPGPFSDFQHTLGEWAWRKGYTCRQIKILIIIPLPSITIISALPVGKRKEEKF